MGKYAPLQDHLNAAARREELRVTMTFSEIEDLLEAAHSNPRWQRLPDSARKHRQWWANQDTSPQAAAWQEAGWLVAKIDLNLGIVVFEW